jgi:hypothetical protein
MNAEKRQSVQAGAVSYCIVALLVSLPFWWLGS